MADNELSIEFKAIDSFSDVLGKLVTGIGSGLVAAVGIGVGAVAGLGVAFTDLLQAGREGADEQARFNSLVGASPLKDFKGQMEAMADTWSQSTKFQKDNILAAEGQLSVYTNIGQSVFPDALKATINLATYMKTDASSAAVTLGKSLEDIAGGSLTLLVRQRLLTKEQAEQAKEMAKNGDAAGAQAQVIGIVNSKIGNLATDMGKAGSGPMTIFSNKIQEIKETLGAGLAAAFNNVFPLLSQLADRIFPILANVVNNFVVPGLQNFIGWLSNLGNIKPPSWLTQIWGAIQQGVHLAIGAFQSVSNWWSENSPAIIAAVMPVWDAIVKGAGEIWKQIQTQLVPVLQEFGQHFQEFGPGGRINVISIIQGIAWVFSNVLVPVVQAAVSIVIGVLTALLWIVNKLTDAYNFLGDAVRGAFGASGGGARNVRIPVAGQRQHGGDVLAGSSYLVVEVGPELFTPRTSGTIIPNGGGAASVTLNVRVSGAYDPQQAARDMKPALRYALRELGVATNG